jgi:hypothetical protein
VNGDAASPTFADNLRLPVHRWYRYSAGFSAAWAGRVVEAHGATRVFDPFAGSGTTLLAAAAAGAESLGTEAHPFVHRVARAKLACRSSPEAYLRLAAEVREAARGVTPALDAYPDLIRRCYPDASLGTLDALRRAIAARADDGPAAALVWLTLVSILRGCAAVDAAQWQYVLPRKPRRRLVDPWGAFDAAVATFAADMRAVGPGAPTEVLRADARTCAGVPDAWADLVVTSPPYPNNYDYADATRLEMSFFGEVARWSDLQAAVRRHLVRSCSQHVDHASSPLETVLAEPGLAPIRPALAVVCAALADLRGQRGGRKKYHLMVAGYFADLARVFVALRRVCRSPARLCLVVGDSAPYGVHVPVMDWLTSLAEAAGFGDARFERLRDRNVRWRNRKHRVPLCEGVLWLRG